MSFEERYKQYKDSGNLIYLPTVEACDFFKVSRLPKNYSSSGNGSNKFSLDALQQNSPLSALTGPQFSTFNSTQYMDSLKNLTVPTVNTRDIVIEVLTNRPYTIKTETKNGITTSSYNYGAGGNTPLYKISISPTNPDGSPFELQLTHEHEWGTQSDIFSSILKGVSDLVGNVDNMFQKIKTIGNTTGNSEDGFKQLPNRRVDLADTYSITKKQTIDIPFSLFTPGGLGVTGEEAFLRDILDPITLITSFSYPKRQNDLGQGPLGALANVAAEKSQANTPAESKLNSLNLINSLNPGFRVFVSDPPSYVNVYHQGGLFSYKNCYVQKFTYKFRNFVDGSSTEIKDVVTDGGIAGILKSVSANANLAYPVIAECMLSITSTEPLFSDDFVALSQDRSSAISAGGGITSVRNIKANSNLGGNS